VQSLDKAAKSTDESVAVLAQRKSEGVDQIQSAFDDLVERLEARKRVLLDELETQFNLKLNLIRELLLVIYFLCSGPQCTSC